MNVAYDISVLGSGVLDPKARTGVFRVVESLARALVASPECDVRFAAGGPSFHPLFGALRYLRTSAEFETIPFLSSSVRARLHSRALQSLIDSSATGERSPAAGVGRRAIRSLLGRATNFVANRPFPLTTDMLRGSAVFHSPYAPLPDWPRDSGLRRVITVYDLIAVTNPGLYEPLAERHELAILESIRPDDCVACISEATRADLCDYSGIDPARVFVTPLAASKELFYPQQDREAVRHTLERHGIPDAPYLLSLSTLKPGKNLVTTIRAFARLASERDTTDLNLVLVGTRGWDYEGIFEAVREAGAVRDRIHFTGFVADDDLAALYSGAVAFVFPSLHEGFGLPVLEAMQCGIPVVTSNVLAVAEVVGDAGILLEPRDIDGFCHALLNLCRDASLRSELSLRAAARAASFSWERCAEATLAAYRAALSQ